MYSYSGEDAHTHIHTPPCKLCKIHSAYLTARGGYLHAPQSARYRHCVCITVLTGRAVCIQTPRPVVRTHTVCIYVYDVSYRQGCEHISVELGYIRSPLPVRYPPCACDHRPGEEACVDQYKLSLHPFFLYGTHCMYVQGEVPYGHHSLYSTHYSLYVQGGMP